MAKPITMAVSTSAWGSGSVGVIDSPITAAAWVLRPPVENRNMFTA